MYGHKYVITSMHAKEGINEICQRMTYHTWPFTKAAHTHTHTHLGNEENVSTNYVYQTVP